MNLQRNILIGALLVITYLMVVQWNKDFVQQDLAPAEAEEGGVALEVGADGLGARRDRRPPPSPRPRRRHPPSRSPRRRCLRNDDKTSCTDSDSSDKTTRKPLPELPTLEPRLVKKSARNLLAREEAALQVYESFCCCPPLRKPDIHGGLAF